MDSEHNNLIRRTGTLQREKSHLFEQNEKGVYGERSKTDAKKQTWIKKWIKEFPKFIGNILVTDVLARAPPLLFDQ